MLRTLSLLLLIVTVGYSQWRDSSRVLVPAPSGKAVKVTQFAIGDTNTWKVSGAIAYMGGNFYIANGTYYVLMAGSGSSSADTATFVTKNTTQVVSGRKYFTSPQYFRGDSTYFKRSDIGGSGTATGTVTMLDGDTIITGSGTAFLSEVVVGQQILLDSAEAFFVKSIINNTQIITTTPNVSGGDFVGVIMTFIITEFAQFKYLNGALISDGDNSYHPRRLSDIGFMYLPYRGALRVGRAASTQWDSGSIGLYSASTGNQNTATGIASFASGSSNVVAGQDAFSSGSSNSVSGNSSASFGSFNTVLGNNAFVAGNSIKTTQQYNFLLGTNITTLRQTLGGFAYSNSADTIYFGHATVSLGVPFVAANFAKPLSGGEELGAFATFADGVTDTSSYVFRQWAGIPGVGGTQTSSFTFEKNFGTSASNLDKWDGNRKVRYIYIDTANGVFLNQQITEVGQNFGDWTLSNKNFIVSSGYVDSDSTLDDGTTWRTSVAYHSGLGASSFGNISTGTISGGNITSSGTVSTTGTGAHTFATAGSGFTAYRDGGAASLNVNTYGNTNGSFYYSNTFAGTRAAPTQIGASQVLGNFMGSGYINGASRDMAKMQYLAKSTPSATNYSSYGRFQFVPDSSTTLTTHTILDWTNLTTPRLTLGTTAGTGRGNLYIDSLYFGTTLAIDANRKHTNVGGIATTGAHGVAPIVDTVTYTSMSSGMSKNLTSTAGMYRLLYTIFCTTADAAAGSVQLTLSFNNGAAQTMTSAAVNLTSTANKEDDAFIFYVASGTPSISTAITGSAGTSKYSVHAVVERLK